MYQIRTRPKDQSSDEEENEQQNQKDSSPIQHVRQEESDSQSVSDDNNVDQKQIDDVDNGVNAVHSDKDDHRISVDFSMFESNIATECGGNDKDKGILSHCKAMQRLGEALRAYLIINSRLHALHNGNYDGIDLETATFTDFIGSGYRVQFLEDFNHFMAEHQYFAEEIKKEMINRYGFKQCNATRCKLTNRHFGRRRAQKHSVEEEAARAMFYRQIFDSLHFQIFHLEECGYRYLSKSPQIPESKTADKEYEQTAVDQELKEAVATINDKKKKCDFGRFQGDGPNKFTLSVSGIDRICFAVESIVILDRFVSTCCTLCS